MADRPDIPGLPDGHSAISRALTDSLGVDWTVWEISPGQLPPKLRRLLGAEVEAKGALLFVSESNEWRALVPAPANWLDLDESALEGCRARAPVVRAGG